MTIETLREEYENSWIMLTITISRVMRIYTSITWVELVLLKI